MPLTDIHGAPHYVWGGDCDGWHLVQAPGLSVIQERVPPGRAEARHYHQRSRQFFYVLAGRARIELPEGPVDLAPGQGLEVAPEVPHRLLNPGDEDLSFLVVSAPPSHGDRVTAA